MDGFFQLSRRNLLPRDGVAIYYGPIFSSEDADRHFRILMEQTPWKSDEVTIFGKRFVTARQIAWYGDESYVYRYSGGIKKALEWTNELLELKEIVENQAKIRFNSCLLNLYHEGREGMGWHSDNENVLGDQPTIASLSLGAVRKFSFRHKHTRQTVSLSLENGSLLIMKDATQTHWQHCLPKSQKVVAPRINLTFRNMMPGSL